MKNSPLLNIFLSLFFLTFLLFIVSFVSAQLKEESFKNMLATPPVSVRHPSTYPVLKSVIGENDSLYISARGALVMDDNSKVVLVAKNENLRFSLASTTKIMTALVSLEQYKKDDVLTVFTDAKEIEGQVVGFKKGEKYKFKDVLYGLLLPSGNDAAYVLAQNYPLGEKGFVEAMNEKARELNLVSTHFKDPAGLLDEQDYSTVLDLARLSSEALKNKVFSQVVSTQKAVITDILGFENFTLYNLNRLLGVSGINGVKTGFTDGAGGVLVTSVERADKRRLIIVVMKSEDRFLDTKTLLDFVSSNIEYKEF